MSRGNYQLIRAILDHEEPDRVPSFHLGYVCLYYDEGQEPRQGIVEALHQMVPQ